MAQEKGRDGGSAASEAERLFADGTCALGLLLYGDVEKVDRGAAGDKIQKALSGLVRMVSDRSVGDEDCPPVLKLLDEFREEMLRFIPQRFDEQRVILDTKLLKVREMIREGANELEVVREEARLANYDAKAWADRYLALQKIVSDRSDTSA